VCVKKENGGMKKFYWVRVFPEAEKAIKERSRKEGKRVTFSATELIMAGALFFAKKEPKNEGQKHAG
jgi:hypothetical protein